MHLIDGVTLSLMRKWGQLAFQDAASPIIDLFIEFHDYLITTLTIILTFVGYALLRLITNKLRDRNVVEAQEIETVWTILPAITLIFLALPSLYLLYLRDEIRDPSITLKAIGHQWYWRYEYSDFINLEFDSYITPTEDLNPGQFRLLEVDNRVVLPFELEVRVLVTAADVIHAWTIPSLGVKADAIPGRLNQITIWISRPGVFYGQCSEICGANHSFIPIALEAVSYSSFANWIKKYAE